ncbi:MAG: sugar ABC transporter ATP-binding protein [Rhodobacteraceae bacterium]|nr:sugar ABC transporter ATP-binding protein [Paracoccaceae bacterium]MCF8520983.1 sugar ABC transporter ATP-binding protein [Paracoccaceae bacterium]
MTGRGQDRYTLTGVTKVYPGVVALQDVSLSVSGGEVVGLIGENGAGKSTLMKVLGGLVHPNRGSITIGGTTFAGLTPAEATRQGIAFVHQELNPFTNLDVTGNVLLGREITRRPFGTLDREAMVRQVRPILKRLGARFGPLDPVAHLSLADQQLLEIARALSMDARLVIFDEPTSSLTLPETQALLGVIDDLRRQGVAVLFISHRLAEVGQIADRVIGLRDGRNAGELARAEITKDRMVRLMIGRDLIRSRPDTAPQPDHMTALRLRGVRTAAWPESAVNLDLRAGEIFGMAGLVGAGRSELACAAFGIDGRRGEVTVGATRLPPRSVAAALQAGLCLVPENRKEHGLVLDFPIAANIALPNLAALSRRWVVDRGAEMALARAGRDRLGIRSQSLTRAAAELSGGNQQKVVLAKWLALNPRVIILDEPTRGIDVGAKAEVYAVMRALAAEGVAIWMISSDMEEVIAVSDRVAVMHRGRVTGILAGSQMTEENILRLAVG